MKTPEDVIESINEAMASGRKIEAIRILRDATGMGLKEAKETIERKRESITPGMITNLEDIPQGGGCIKTAACFALAAGGLFWLFL